MTGTEPIADHGLVPEDGILKEFSLPNGNVVRTPQGRGVRRDDG